MMYDAEILCGDIFKWCAAFAKIIMIIFYVFPTKGLFYDFIISFFIWVKSFCKILEVGNCSERVDQEWCCREENIFQSLR
jgi:hypothetical protein